MNLITILTFAKKYWFLGLLAAAAVYHYIKMDNMQKLLEVSNKSHETQILELKKNHEEEIERREAIQRDYEVKLENIDKKYKRARAQLWRERQKRIKEIEQEKPEQLIERIEEAFGLRYVPKE